MKIKAVAFDMDGVLVDVRSSWQHVHQSLGTANKVNLELYLRGQMDYAELMRRDIALWGRIHIGEIRRILSSAPLMKNAELTISSLKAAGMKTVIVSAGISILAEQLQTELAIDRVLANRIHFDEDGFVTGDGEIVVDLKNKVTPLKAHLLREGISCSRCAVVGDSIYDIPLFEFAAVSIAFNTTDYRVIKAADVVVRNKDLSKILPYLIG